MFKVDSSKPVVKSSIGGKKSAKPKRAGLGGTKKVASNVNFEKLEQESTSVAAEQAREKQFQASRLASSDKLDTEGRRSSQTTIDQKPVSQARRDQAHARLGMGSGNKKLVVSAHTLDFQEIHQSNNFNTTSSKSSFMSSMDSTATSTQSNNTNSSASNSTPTSHHLPVTSAPGTSNSAVGTPGSSASSWFSKATPFSKTQQPNIYENSDDISDLLGKSTLADGGMAEAEYDQHGLITK
jgi:hypothetical protein